MATHTITNVPIFRSGTWNGIDVTLQNLRDMQRNFSIADQHVFLKLGHNDAQAVTDGQPALGSVSALRVYNNTLLADFIGVPDLIFQAMKKGLYRGISVELLKNVEGIDGWVLDAVALLGADQPAISGLADLQKLVASRNTQHRLCFSIAFAMPGRRSAAAVDPPDELAQLRAENAALKASNEADRLNFARSQEAAAARAHQHDIIGALEAAVRAHTILPRTRYALMKAKKLDELAECLKFTRADLELYIDAHAHSSDPLSFLRAPVARNTTESGLAGEEKTPVASLAERSRAIFARGGAPDIFAALTLAVAQDGSEMTRILQHDLEA